MIKTDPKRWLRSRKNGVVFAYSPYLAGNPNVEEVTEEQAFPERFIPDAQKGRKPRVDLAEVSVEEPPRQTTPLDLEASRGLNGPPASAPEAQGGDTPMVQPKKAKKGGLVK